MTDLLPVVSGKTATSKTGFVFELTSRHWQISYEHKLSLEWIDKYIAKDLAESFIKLLAYYAGIYSSAHTQNLSERFFHYSRVTLDGTDRQLSRISSTNLINYRATLDREHEWYLGSLRGLFKSWVDLGYSGVDEDVPSLLAGWRLRGNIKGRAVQTLSPEEGPLSDLEFAALHQALTDGFETGAVRLEDFMLVELFAVTGRRPSQLADIKAKDIIEATSTDGLREFLLNVPRRKQRGINWRKQFKAFALVPEIGVALKALIEQNTMKLSAHTGNLSKNLVDELPVFPDWKIIEEAFNAQPAINVDGTLKTQEFHHLTNHLRSWLDKVVSALEIHSERTGKTLRVFPTRLRRTLATRAAREGHGELIIAELLDHTDTQNARVYTENVPEHVDAINEAVARQLAPYAQAFAGVLVVHEHDALRGGDLASRVRSEQGVVGTCGHHGFCGAYGPIACYTCRQFQPWLDAPHQDVLNALLFERERILKITQDTTMVAVNDRTILAVTQVVQLCAARRSTLSVEASIG